MPRRIALAAALAFATAAAAQEKAGFVDGTHTNPDGTTSPYVVFVPKGYDGTKPVPVILFLHGAGETKGGAKMPKDVGLPAYIAKNADTFEYLTVIPQSEKRTWRAKTADGDRAVRILAEVEKTFKTDPDRVVLSGLSMGGYGTWSHAAAMPDKWAAIVPVCGGGDPKAAATFKHIPCWAFHGDKDTAVKVDQSRDMVKALKDAGGEPKYTEYPGVGHNSWDQAYATPELWAWLAKQSKKAK
jgi:predicted peptidase